ncbi:MAG TPA: hypothetical protein VE981_17725 [Planctomycetota bacterium]|nr:hypothetical protein [Planctomycetota bacterium]
MWSEYRANDPDGMFSQTPKFGPEWTEEKARDALKKIYAQAQVLAKKEFDDELKALQAQNKGK